MNMTSPTGKRIYW